MRQLDTQLYWSVERPVYLNFWYDRIYKLFGSYFIERQPEWNSSIWRLRFAVRLALPYITATIVWWSSARRIVIVASLMRLIISSSTLTAHIFILYITLQKKPKLKRELVVDSEQNIFYVSAAKRSNKRYKQYCLQSKRHCFSLIFMKQMSPANILYRN